MADTCIGLDIGSSAIKAIQVKRSRRRTRLLNFGIELLPPQAIVDGAIMDQAAVVEAILRLRAALGVKGKQVATAIAGHQVIVKKLVLPPLRAGELTAQIQLEAEQHIPFRRDEVEIDHQVITARNAGGQMEVILVAAKKELIADYTQVIREAGLTPAVMDVAAFSVQNAYEASYGAAGRRAGVDDEDDLDDDDGTRAVALVHIGHALAHVNVVAGGASAFTRDVSTGGTAFTEEIQRRLHVGHDEAEAMKRAACEGEASGASGAAALAIIEEVADATAAKLQRTLDFFLASAGDVKLARILLSGGAARVPALGRKLANRSGVQVDLFDPFRRMEIDELVLDAAFVRAHAPEAAVAVGLALRSAREKDGSAAAA